jgi:hypothetical protein
VFFCDELVHALFVPRRMKRTLYNETELILVC